MANKFTKQLLETDFLKGGSIHAVGLMLGHTTFYTETRTAYNTDGRSNELRDTKETFICFLAAMSDQDLIDLDFVSN